MSDCKILPSISDEDQKLLDQAREWLAGHSSQMDRILLRSLTGRFGADFSAAVAHEFICQTPQHASLIDRVCQLAAEPVMPVQTSNLTVVFVPTLGYFLDRNGRKRGKPIEDLVQQLGLDLLVVKTNPAKSFAHNAQVVIDTLLARGESKLLLLSMSKGGSDVKAALKSPQSRDAFRNVRAWINVCGALDGSPAVNLLLDSRDATGQQPFIDWLHRFWPESIETGLDVLRECGHGEGRPLSGELDLPEHIQLINVVPFCRQRHCCLPHTRTFFKAMEALGPNDGFVLLEDAIFKPGLILPLWGTDHYIDRACDASALGLALIRYVIEHHQEKCSTGENHPPNDRNLAASNTDESVDATADEVAALADKNRGVADQLRLRNARESQTGFAVGRYLQPPPMLFTRDGHNIFLGDTYRGASAFLLGGGPSLVSHDLTKLNRSGIVTCAMNNAATLFRPQLWVCVDDPGNFADVIWRDPGILKFTPLCHMEKQFTVRNAAGELVLSEELVGDMPAVFAYRRNETFNAEQWLYEDTFNWGNEAHLVDAWGQKGSRSVMYVGIRLLFYLGIRRIFLVGCDFRMEDGAQNYAFAQDRTPSAVRNNNDSYRILNTRLEKLRPYFAQEGLEVFNCTAKSGLTVFSHIPFEQAIDMARAGMPQQVNTAGMYDRLKRLRDAEKQAKRDIPAAAASNGVPPSPPIPVPDLTLVTAVDRGCLERLKLTWPTWMRFRPELRTWPVILIHDDSIDPQADLRPLVGDHPDIRFVPWEMPQAENQREKMLNAYVRIPATEVRTSWYMKVDVDVMATDSAAWISPEWFIPDEKGRPPVYVASPWGYTKTVISLMSGCMGRYDARTTRSAPFEHTVYSGRVMR